MSDFSDFWKRLESKGIRGWLSQHDHYATSQGCFPVPVSVSRAQTILTVSVGLAVGFGLIYAFNIVGLLAGLPTS